jgi:hypothetical protein
MMLKSVIRARALALSSHPELKLTSSLAGFLFQELQRQ